jgi:hypothetical protein
MTTPLSKRNDALPSDTDSASDSDVGAARGLIAAAATPETDSDSDAVEGAVLGGVESDDEQEESRILVEHSKELDDSLRAALYPEEVAEAAAAAAERARSQAFTSQRAEFEDAEVQAPS